MGENLSKLLANKYDGINRARELRAMHTAVTESILHLLCDGFVESCERNKARWMIIPDFLMVFLSLYSGELTQV